MKSMKKQFQLAILCLPAMVLGKCGEKASNDKGDSKACTDSTKDNDTTDTTKDPTTMDKDTAHRQVAFPLSTDGSP